MLEHITERRKLIKKMNVILENRHLTAADIDNLIIIRCKLNELNRIIDGEPLTTEVRALSRKDRQKVRDLYRTGLYTQADLAFSFRVTQSAISQMVKGVKKDVLSQNNT